MNCEITFMRPEDWLAVREIYREGIATGNATFETELPGWEKWDSGHRKDCRLIARRGEQIIGWAALSPVSARQVYAGVAEVSVYVAAACARKRRRQSATASADRRIREPRHLDSASGSLS